MPSVYQVAGYLVSRSLIAYNAYILQTVKLLDCRGGPLDEISCCTQNPKSTALWVEQ